MSLKALKEEILDKIDGLDVYSKYIGVNIKPGKAMRSPLREGDKSPSFNVYRSSNGQLLFKDFAGDRGDIFKFVELLFNCSFSEAIQKIASDFNISPPNEKISRLKPVRKLEIKSYRMKEEAKFDYDIRPWEGYDLRYWNQFSIPPEVLTKYNVNACKFYKIGNLVVESTPEDPMYVYTYTSGHVRFYRPLTKDKKNKQIGNACGDDIFGFEQAMDMSKLGIEAICICAGQKDVLSLFSNTSFAAICLNSESCFLKTEQYIQLKHLSDNIIIIYDNDETGKKSALKLQNEYPDIIICDISNITNLKDVSDYYKQKKEENEQGYFLEDNLAIKIIKLIHDKINS